MQKGGTRLAREVKKLLESPPDGIICYQKEDKINNLIITLLGPSETPYENGVFTVEAEIDENYPFEPPRIKFVTRIYHPNVDESGRICLDLLKMPPKGSWKPTITLENLLVAVQWLLKHPNPDDPLVTEIAQQYKSNKLEFEKQAKLYTQKYAI